MNFVFADTFYFIALLSKNDEAHARAVEFTRTYRGSFVTTEWVLTELETVWPRHRRDEPNFCKRSTA